jgi:hypothetical protein
LNVRTALLGLFVALTIVFASTTVYESGMRATLTATSTSTVTATNVSTITTTLSEGEGSLVFISPTSEQGLQLRVVLNSSTIPTNGTLSAQIAMYNTLDENVSVAVTEDQQMSSWNGGDFLCGFNPSGNLVGFAVFQGDVAATNLSEAGKPLELDPTVFIPCPTEVSYPANATFFPSGDRVSYANGVAAAVNAKTVGCETTGQEFQCLGTGLVGYWNDSIPTAGNLGFSSPAFVHFPPGEYTIVATDDWNQYVYATFVVQPPGASSSSSTSNTAVANAAVATITVTTTLTTPASQATTTYAIPTTNCTLLGPVETTTTTITVGPTPPASTTTTTVTTTSTSYTQTVTVTSCTYSESTVTSTVTTTENP